MLLKPELVTDKTPVEHIQSFYKYCGEYGCYALCIVKAAKKWLKKNGLFNRSYELSYEKSIIEGIQYGWIDFNFDNYADSNNFYVNAPEKFLSYLISRVVFVAKMSRTYVAKPDEIEIDFWAKTEADGDKGIGHFVLPDDTDTIQNSVTVKKGFIYSKRIFKLAQNSALLT